MKTKIIRKTGLVPPIASKSNSNANIDHTKKTPNNAWHKKKLQIIDKLALFLKNKLSKNLIF